MPKRNHSSPKDIFLPLEQMMRFKLHSLLKEPSQKHLFASREDFLQKQFEDIFPKNEIITTSLSSQLTHLHQPIKKKLKPGIDHDYLLLWFVCFLTKVDWSITDGFDHVPLLSSDNIFQVLEDLIGHEKRLGPLLHFWGLLPYIMNSRTQNDCPLEQKYREYPPASWPHAFSCANQCQNKYSKKGREDKCSSIIYIAESWISTQECNADFLKWVKNQPDIYIMDGVEEHNKFQFVLNEDARYLLLSR